MGKTLVTLNPQRRGVRQSALVHACVRHYLWEHARRSLPTCARAAWWTSSSGRWCATRGRYPLVMTRLSDHAPPRHGSSGHPLRGGRVGRSNSGARASRLGWLRGLRRLSEFAVRPSERRNYLGDYQSESAAALGRRPSNASRGAWRCASQSWTTTGYPVHHPSRVVLGGATASKVATGHCPRAPAPARRGELIGRRGPAHARHRGHRL
jgi:hypothetical protein